MDKTTFIDSLKHYCYDSPKHGPLFIDFDDKDKSIIAGTINKGNIEPVFRHNYDDNYSIDDNLSEFINKIESTDR